jgi:hypothetical protein
MSRRGEKINAERVLEGVGVDGQTVLQWSLKKLNGFNVSV